MKASCSMFGQILKFIPRAGFERIVKEPKTGHRSQSASTRSMRRRLRRQFMPAALSSMHGWAISHKTPGNSAS